MKKTNKIFIIILILFLLGSTNAYCLNLESEELNILDRMQYKECVVTLNGKDYLVLVNRITNQVEYWWNFPEQQWVYEVFIDDFQASYLKQQQGQ